MRLPNKTTLLSIVPLLLAMQTRALAEELIGNANVDSATKIQSMNRSVNEDWNLNDQQDTHLLVLFDPGSSRIGPQYAHALEVFATYLKAHPKTTADIFGHSDRMSGTPADFELAQSRANAVRQILIVPYGIDADRLKAEGYGQVTARETNITKSEKQMNRRVFALIRDPSPS